MKVVERVVERKEKVYVASDGREFFSEGECEAYEFRILYDEAQKAVSQIPKASCNPPGDSGYDRSYRLYYVRNADELDAVKQYEFTNPDAAGHEFEPKSYPCWVRTSAEVDTGYGDMDSIDEVIREAEGYLRELRMIASNLDGEENR